MVHVQVRDTGIGMSPAQTELIFEPFTQADASISRRFGGTGLGTTIARQLVEAMSGRIEVESALGRGSAFHVWLPLALGHAPREPQSPDDAPQLPPLHILIADDVEQNLELLTLVLQSGGHHVESVHNGEQAVERFLAGHFDVILMDVYMPVIDGLQATRLIRQHERSRGLVVTPVIALTASVMDDDRREAWQAGMNGFAVKPLDIPRLYDEIARVLEGRPTGAGDGPVACANQTPERTIDWERGAVLWSGRTWLADRILTFLDEAPDKYPLPDSRHDLDPQALLFSLHALRGVAGNLALMAMSRQAAELEDLGRAGRIDEVLGRLPELRALMDTARQEAMIVRQEAPAFESSRTSSSSISDTCLESAMMSLRLVLARNELDEAALRVVCAGLEARGGLDRVRALRAAIDAFEFERAGALLDTILADTSVRADD